MNSLEWAFEQFCKRRKVDIEKHFANDIQQLAESCPILEMPLEVIILILSFTPLKMCLSLIFVCKTFHHAIMGSNVKSHVYWNKKIYEHILAQRGGTRALAKGFDNHLFLHREPTLKMRYGWLFSNDPDERIEIFSHIRSDKVTLRRASVVNQFEYRQFLTKDGVILNAYYYDIGAPRWRSYVKTNCESKFIHDNDRILHITEMCSGPIHDIKCNSQTLVIHLHKHSDYTFIGEGQYGKDEDEVVEHGDGKWIFPDGKILEGKNVACNGYPVFN